MNKNKLILKHCPNFYKIINFDYNIEDKLTIKLIDIYKSYIFNNDFNNEEDLIKIEKFDSVINKYLNDYHFRKDMADKLLNIKVKSNSNSLINTIVDKIIELFDNYEMGYTRNIYFARWF